MVMYLCSLWTNPIVSRQGNACVFCVEQFSQFRRDFAHAPCSLCSDPVVRATEEEQ